MLQFQRVDSAGHHPSEVCSGTESNLNHYCRDMGQINVPAAQDITPGKTSITIGILDTGVDATHPGANFAKMLLQIQKLTQVFRKSAAAVNVRTFF